jgi:NAD(P)-dependent dehydrogenase (short-subunit alcohol dehydrogenase family)
MPSSLEDRCALVTGSSRGIGRAIAERLADAGAAVAVHGLAQSADLDAAAESVAGPAVTGDLGTTDAPVEIIEHAREALGGLDILINCAGIVMPKPVGELDVGTWDRTLDVNLRGAFLCAQAAGRHMITRGYGRIVSVSSQAASVAIEGYLPYGVSKAGLEIMTRYLAAEWSGRGVTVNVVAPAFVRTDLTAAVFEAMPDLYDDQLARVLVKRMCEPSEVAAAVAYLVSEDAGYTTGEVIHVDGGYLSL